MNPNDVIDFFFFFYFICFYFFELFTRACVDTSETGYLESCELLGPFKLTGKYARLTKEGQILWLFNFLST